MSIGQGPFQLTYTPDLEQTAYNQLMGQDRDKPVIVATTRAIGATAQVLEDAVFDFATGILFTQATGAALDRWGAIVGQRRLGLVDADYRRVIGARILINRCNGGMDAIAKIVRVIVQGPAWTVTPGPASYVVCFVTAEPLSPALLRFIRRAMIPEYPDASARSVAPAGYDVAVAYGGTGTLILGDEPAGTAMLSGVAGTMPTPPGFETRLDFGTFGADL